MRWSKCVDVEWMATSVVVWWAVVCTVHPIRYEGGILWYRPSCRIFWPAITARFHDSSELVRVRNEMMKLTSKLCHLPPVIEMAGPHRVQRFTKKSHVKWSVAGILARLWEVVLKERGPETEVPLYKQINVIVCNHNWICETFTDKRINQQSQI